MAAEVASHSLGTGEVDSVVGPSRRANWRPQLYRARIRPRKIVHCEGRLKRVCFLNEVGVYWDYLSDYLSRQRGGTAMPWLKFERPAGGRAREGEKKKKKEVMLVSLRPNLIPVDS